ncbi:hypothetical protein BGZ75_008585 [Mortierella antarctica]|nr:hypothetical protein BGZ75_008585 [Mortierella antarctica]
MEAVSSLFRMVKVFLTVCSFYLKLGFIHLAREMTMHSEWAATALSPLDQVRESISIASKLAKELAKEAAIRQSWQIYNRGEYKTSTEDWLLPADSKRKDKPELLSKVIQDPKYMRAEIVIIMLGSQDVLRKDPTITPQDTLRNIELVCQALRRTGNSSKSIYLCTIPTAGDDTFLTEEQRADNLMRNRLIQDYVKKNEEGVLAGLEIDLASNFEMKRRNLYWQDGRHFSDNGYGKIAKDWIPIIRPDMVKREFLLFRSDLGL